MRPELSGTIGRYKLSRIQQCRGFTLVELLVVIGIIALLISMLLPALNGVREKARQIKCMSNIRQLSMAAVMFANDHNGQMPGRAGNPTGFWWEGGASIFVFDDTGNIRRVTEVYPPGGLDDSIHVKEKVADWIAWQRRKDPFTGEISTAANQNITYSGLAPYVGGTWTLTPPGDYDASNDVSGMLEDISRCPSDNVEMRPSRLDPSHGYYRYSYAINIAYANPVWDFPRTTGGGGRWTGGERSDGVFTGKISSIRRASDKVLFVCQDEKTLTNGTFVPNAAIWHVAGHQNMIIDLVSSRHSRRFVRATNRMNVHEGNEDVLGNVGFADGHGAYFSRKDALRSQHSGNPNPDPSGF
jgi:prepilin-type N-terminal cleavage/methylation domain-containing protein/prepilin-type processing-associated H-X9-DG protein